LQNSIKVAPKRAEPTNKKGISGNHSVHLIDEIQVPDEPVVTIRPKSKWVALDLFDIWKYRELLYFLTWRDVKVRYKQTFLGASWVVIQPLLTMAIFTLLFGRLIGMPSDGIPYPLFVFAGLLPWTFVSSSISRSGNSLVTNSNLITKVYFPRMIIPGSSVLGGLVDLAVSFVFLVILMVYYRTPLTSHIAMLPVLVLMTALFTIGFGMWSSALNVKYRDMGYALPFMVQLWMFVTPIFYPTSFVHSRLAWILKLNPLTGIVEGYRASLFGLSFDWGSIAISAVSTTVLLIYSAFAFRSMEKHFADVV